MVSIWWRRTVFLILAGAASNLATLQMAGAQQTETTATASAPLIAPTDVAPEDVRRLVEARQGVMTDLDLDADSLAQMMSGEIPSDDVAQTAHAIARNAHASVTAFQQRALGGRAKPEVWSNWADFSQRMEAFARNADALAAVADSGDLARVSSLMRDTLTCQQCHDIYRGPPPVAPVR